MKKRNKISIYDCGISNHFTVKINSEKFKNIPATYRCNCNHCKFRSYCNYDNYTIRKYDCIVEQSILYKLYSLFSTIVLFVFSVLVWYNMPWPKALAIIGITTLILYIICYIIEDLVSYFWNYTFYNTVKKLEEKNKKIKELDESKKIQEAKERTEAIPYHKQIVNAINLVNYLNNLLENNDFVSSKECLTPCINILNEIITILKENNSSYPRVASLFETKLPEFYDFLVQYSARISADCVDKEINLILNNTINNFSDYLKNQKVKVIFDTNQDIAKISFKASSEAINHMIGGYEYEFNKK